MIQKKIIGQIIFWLILSLLFLNISFQIFSNWKFYTAKFNPNVLEKIYRYSQFAPDPNDRKLIIEDNDLFAYSGYLYVKGVSPSVIQIEHPPLTKYIFGLSILFFDNPNVAQIFFGIGLLVVLYLIGYRVLRSHTWSLLPPLILSFDGNFQNQFRLSYLDLSHAFFISCAILFFLKSASNKRYYLLTSIFLGAALMSKYMGFVIVPLLFFYTFFARKEDFKKFTYSLILVPTIYLLNFTALFLRGGNIFYNFFDLHLQIFRLYRSYLPDYPWGEIWRLLATGQWRVWFGNSQFIRVSEWNIFWPLTLLSLIITVFMIKKSKNEAFILVTLFSLLYLFTSSFHVIFPRHLLIYLPFGYLLLTFMAKIIFEKFKVKKLIDAK